MKIAVIQVGTIGGPIAQGNLFRTTIGWRVCFEDEKAVCGIQEFYLHNIYK